jgi:hypothetical protein
VFTKNQAGPVTGVRPSSAELEQTVSLMAFWALEGPVFGTFIGLSHANQSHLRRALSALLLDKALQAYFASGHRGAGHMFHGQGL